MTKAYSIFLTVLFTVFIGGVLVISALLPKEEFSEMENRFLQKPPELSIETVKNGKFMENAEKYVSDHIAGRDLWVAAKAWGERLSGKQENNGVYFAAQDTLINRVEEPDGETWEQLDQNLEYLDQLVSNAGVPVYFGLIPSAAQVWHDRLPDGAPTADEAAIIETLYSRTAARTVDLLSVLSAHSGEELYYRTDHHWTSLGAYYASAAYCQANGITPWALDSYDTVIRTGYTGSLYMYGGHPTELKDNPDYSAARFPHAGYSMVYYRDGVQYNGQAVNGGTNEYAGMFLCGDQPLTVITTDNKNGKTLLVFKESYGNAFVPYMIDYYERIVVVDIREEVGSVGDIIAQYGVTDALIINNCQAATSLRSNLESRALS